MSFIYSRKKLASVIFIVIFGLAALFLYVRGPAEDTFELGSVSTQDKQRLTNEDTDEDGLKDWEELLWKTDKANSDTDGDGFSDSEEVSQGRSPVEKGPKDAIAIQETHEEGAGVKGDNITEQFLDLLVAAALKTKIQYGPTKKINPEVLSARVLSGGLLEYQEPVIDEKNIKTISDNSDEAIRAYLNHVAEIELEFIDEPARGKYQALFGFLKTEDPTYLKKFSTAIDGYKKAVTQLSAVSVPSSWKQEHVDIVNVLARMGEDLQNISIFEKDPVKGSLAVDSYLRNFEEYIQLHSHIQSRFTKADIKFGEEESAALFFEYGA